jgi:hypothetical protein
VLGQLPLQAGLARGRLGGGIDLGEGHGEAVLSVHRDHRAGRTDGMARRTVTMVAGTCF